MAISKLKDLSMRLFSLRVQLCACFVLRASQSSKVLQLVERTRRFSEVRTRRFFEVRTRRFFEVRTRPFFLESTPYMPPRVLSRVELVIKDQHLQVTLDRSASSISGILTS